MLIDDSENFFKKKCDAKKKENSKNMIKKQNDEMKMRIFKK